MVCVTLIFISIVSVPSQVEGAFRTSRDRNQKSEMVAGNDGAQPRTLADDGGDLGQSLQVRHKP